MVNHKFYPPARFSETLTHTSPISFEHHKTRTSRPQLSANQHDVNLFCMAMGKFCGKNNQDKNDNDDQEELPVPNTKL